MVSKCTRQIACHKRGKQNTRMCFILRMLTLTPKRKHNLVHQKISYHYPVYSFNSLTCCLCRDESRVEVVEARQDISYNTISNSPTLLSIDFHQFPPEKGYDYQYNLEERNAMRVYSTSHNNTKYNTNTQGERMRYEMVVFLYL